MELVCSTNCVLKDVTASLSLVCRNVCVCVFVYSMYVCVFGLCLCVFCEEYDAYLSLYITHEN